MEQEEKLRGEVKTVMEFAYLCDRVSAGQGCLVAVTAITSWACVKYLGSMVRCCMAEDFF